MALVAVLLLTLSVQSANAASTLFGGATMGPGHVILVSDATDNPGNTTNDFSGVRFDDAAGLPWASLATVMADYNVTDDNCGGGSPRFQIQVDTNGDTVSDGNVFVAIGPSPSFTGCAAGWQSTGNIIGNSDAGRYDYGQFGGSPFTIYAGAPANVLAGTVRNISIVVDGSWSAAATGGDSEQTVLIDNVVINSTTYDFSPAPVTVTIDKFIDGAMATSGSANSSAFPMTATWDAANIGAGSGNYDLDADGFNGDPTPYQAITASMTSGADYTTSEVTGGSVVGADCTTGQPYALAGYSSGDTFAEAASAATSTTAPALTDITSNKYIIVRNVTCSPTPPAPPAPPANACATPTVAPAGYTLQNGTSGNNTVVLAPNTMFVGKGGNDTVTGGDGNYIVCAAGGNDTITLGNGNSTIDASGGNNTVMVGNGEGSIKTANGNDTVVAGDGARTIAVGGGNNKVTSGDGAQTITAGNGNDEIKAGGGDDTVNAGGGNNKIWGEAGADMLTSAAGNDQLDGGADQDTCQAGGGTNTKTSCEL